MKDPKAKVAETKQTFPPVDEEKPKASEELDEKALLTKVQKMKPITSKPLIERAIYLFEYKNRDFLKLFQKTIVQINLEGLHIENGSERDLRTKKLTAEEKKNLALDYIGGVEFIDMHYRLFVVEGVGHLGMKKLEERIVKSTANNSNFKIMKDPTITFEHRLYSEFDVDIKKIKLREPLKTLVLQPQLYLREKVPLEIYDTIITLVKVREKNTIQEIVSSDLWLTAAVRVVLTRPSSTSSETTERLSTTTTFTEYRSAVRSKREARRARPLTWIWARTTSPPRRPRWSAWRMCARVSAKVIRIHQNKWLQVLSTSPLWQAMSLQLPTHRPS